MAGEEVLFKNIESILMLSMTRHQSSRSNIPISRAWVNMVVSSWVFGVASEIAEVDG